MNRYKDEAVVLRSRAVGEADGMVELLTLTEGKISALVKGLRKSRKRGALTLTGNVIHFSAEIKKESTGNFYYFGEGEIIQSVFNKIHNPAVLSSFYSTLRSVDSLLPASDPDPSVYQLLSGFIHQLSHSEESELEKLESFTLWRMFRYAGMISWPIHCNLCGIQVADQIALDRDFGILCCNHCLRKNNPRSAESLHPEIARLIVDSLRKKFSNIDFPGKKEIRDSLKIQDSMLRAWTDRKEKHY